MKFLCLMKCETMLNDILPVLNPDLPVADLILPLSDLNVHLVRFTLTLACVCFVRVPRRDGPWDGEYNLSVCPQGTAAADTGGTSRTGGTAPGTGVAAAAVDRPTWSSERPTPVSAARV